jgi:exonuclease SbcD
LPVVDGGEQDALIEGVRAVYREVTDRALTKSDGGAIVAMGHLYMAGGELSELSERRILGGNQHALPADLFPPELVYVALGHLHRAQRLGDGRIRYSGSPIPLSMAEAGYPHQVVLVDVRNGALESSRALHVPHRVEMMRIPAAGSATLPEVIRAIKELPERSVLEEPLRPFLDVEIRREKPEPGLQQQILDAVSDRAVRLVRIATVDTGGKLPLAEALRGKTLDSLTPEQVFVERYRRAYNEAPPAELLAAFHVLLDVAQAGMP